VKYFRKDIIKVQVVGSLYIHGLLHGKIKIKIDNNVSGNHASTIFRAKELKIILGQWRKTCRVTIFSIEADNY